MSQRYNGWFDWISWRAEYELLEQHRVKIQFGFTEESSPISDTKKQTQWTFVECFDTRFVVHMEHNSYHGSWHQSYSNGNDGFYYSWKRMYSFSANDFICDASEIERDRCFTMTRDGEYCIIRLYRIIYVPRSEPRRHPIREGKILKYGSWVAWFFDLNLYRRLHQSAFG